MMPLSFSGAVGNVCGSRLCCLFTLVMIINQVAVFANQANPNVPPWSEPSKLIQFPLQHRQPSTATATTLTATTKSLDETPLYQSAGLHYLDLWCGTPTPQHITVLVDTGSPVTAFPCTGCKSCGSHLYPYFNPSKSSSFLQSDCLSSTCASGSCSPTGGCEISTTYGDGSSWIAYIAGDQCFIDGGYHSTASSTPFAFQFVFGCQERVSSSFANNVPNGILGMSNSADSLWSQMYKAGKLQQPMFSVCYTPSLFLGFGVRSNLQEGILTLGGTDSNLHTSTMVYTSNATSASDIFYHVTVRKAYLLGGTNGTNPNKLVTLSLSSSQLNPKYGNIVDSGTTFTQFTTAWESAFLQAWKSVVGTPFSTQEFQDIDLNSLPTLVLQVVGDPVNAQISTTEGLAGSLDPQHPDDVLLLFPPSHYVQLQFYNGTDALYAPEIIFGGTDLNILGADFIMENDVLFDLANNRIGWAASECNYSQTVSVQGPTPGSAPPPTAVATPAPTVRPTPLPTAKPTLPPTPHPTTNPTRITSTAPAVPIKIPAGYCFSEFNLVEVQEKGLVAMKDLRIGDKVIDANGNIASIYSFGHYDPTIWAEYLQIYFKGQSNKPLEITRDHLLFINGTAIPASRVAAGDVISLTVSSTNPKARVVQKITVVVRKGVYAPFSTSGTIMVSGVPVSCYVSLQANSPMLFLGHFRTPLTMHWVAHISQAPHRLFCHVLGVEYCRKTETYNQDGISHWVQGPYYVGKWCVQQHGIVMAAIFIPAFAVGLMFYGLEVGWMYLLIALVGTLCIQKRNKVVKMV